MSKHDKGSRKKSTGKSANKKEQEKVRLNKGKTIAFVLVLIFAVYFGGVALFHKIFVPRTTLEGYDFSFKTPGYIVEKLEEDTLNRAITLIERNGEETINLHETLDYEKSAEAPSEGWIDKKTPWMWPVYIFYGNELQGQIHVSYSDDKLEGVVDNLKAMQPENIKKPQDAHLARSGNEYVIVPEDMGTEIIKEKLVAGLRDIITNDSVTEINLEEMDCYTSPAIFSDDENLQQEYELYKKVGFQHLVFDMSNAEEVLETPQIIELYEGSELSREKITDYVDELAAKYETYEEERPFVNHYGDTITVGTGADTYGFLMDREATVDMIYEELKSGKSNNVKPVWIREADVRNSDGSDIAGTYIEICIEEQELWAYIDGVQVCSTEVVTGRSDLFDTPRGVFQILDMARDVHLKGEAKLPNGKKEKWDSFVNFWMAINWNGIGLHNASWRSEFGGTIYQWDGSHGCVNMDYDTAEYLYNNFDYGTPVIVW